MTTDLAHLGLVLAHDGVEQVVASVHAFPHQMKLSEHRLVRDAPPLGLLDGDLDPQQHTPQPLQVLLHGALVSPVTVPVYGEGYGSADEVAEDCRDDRFHMRTPVVGLNKR